MNGIEEIVGAIKRLKSAVIFTHTRPDGDTLGSGMALHRALFLLGIESEIVNDGEIPEKFLFLPEAGKIKRFPTLDAEGYICVDASDENRLGELRSTFLKGAKRGKVTVNIDHHISNTRYCKYNYVVSCSSNCENIARIISRLGLNFDREIADYLMVGLYTDTGGFSHSDVSGETFRTAALALDAGTDVGDISYRVFKKQSKARAQFYLEVLGGLRFLLDDRFAVALVKGEQLTRYGLKQDATEGIVDFALSIDCVEVSICLLEVKKGQYKASLRSKNADVNRIAATFGGGGHIRAAGCMLFGDLEEVIDRLRYCVYQNLE